MAEKVPRKPGESPSRNPQSGGPEARHRSERRKIGRDGAFSRRAWKVGAVFLLAGSFSAAFAATPDMDAPPLLWNDSPSMDTGIYWKSGAAPSLGAVVSVEIPEAARLHAQSRSIEIGWGSFLKPIAAVGGDHVCVSVESGLEINGWKVAEVRRFDSAGYVVAAWSHCRPLQNNEFFLYAPRVPESYDSRYYGPVRVEMIKGVYEPLWTW